MRRGSKSVADVSVLVGMVVFDLLCLFLLKPSGLSGGGMGW
jgi:hypothetical protein